MMLEPGIGGKIARALCLYKIGIIFYETEENAQSLQHSKDSLTIWQSCKRVKFWLFKFVMEFL